MRTTAQAFLDNPNKRVTLLGWFHYSVDYRIGTRYLDEPILDNIKLQANQVPFLRELLRTDSIYIGNNITFENLNPLSSFLGMLGNPEKGGLPLPEFKRRQQLHLDAEIAAMLDVPSFVEKAQSIYGYSNFLNDASGSFCEIDDEHVFEKLAEQTVFIYIEADASDEKFLIERAARSPKPLYYREPFLDEQLNAYQQEKNISYVTEIDPADFITWVFPKLFNARVPRYKAIADKYGYTISARDAFEAKSADEFVELITKALD